VPREQLPFEFLINALRLPGGFEPALFEARTGLSMDSIRTRLASLAGRGLLESTESRCRASATGLSFLNDLLAEFLPSGESSQRVTRTRA
jgi:oxygen-independent coproporphyrinogen-3 oxidase